MCGRFVIAGNKQALVDTFEVITDQSPDIQPSWNVAPMQDIRFITERPDADGVLERRLETARWGLVPVWSKDPKAGARMINARSETITEKPSFRTAAAKRRALIPMNGYYEWQKNQDGTKTPTYLHPENEDELLAVAGLYEFWPNPELAEDHPEKWLVTATVITTSATDALGHIHERSPLIIPKDLQVDWLDSATTDKNQVRELVNAMPEPHLVPRVVGKEVGSVRNNGPQLIVEVRGG
ncbi:SOS response-associated peptidase [Arthrobacter sp. CAN_A1]|uniref:SOS response-associated peptidase n=1 Tax=Arthrobacter sp. CAN_A1 TaxID=2787717 RepID=UPI0018CBE48A